MFSKSLFSTTLSLVALTAPAHAQAAGAGGAIGSFIPLILIFAIMYFLLIRPQQKKVKEHAAMVEALRRGDQVVTQGGIVGKVSKVKDDGEIEVEIAEGVKVRLIKATVAQVLNKTEPAK
ncbi:preprotein translocase subunit YajC [Litoreibacter roseus]|uniref:Sec translocon accessory complex subunit YajC n=1 Tax=Litoreibacter roseus TaxID=2601869 RepID=A0A6N6JHQ7_9RHOB|nr:preprotein translocase subunit YajC [Litoreibacter roseus]GFE65871.1 preprotein translocase subunit YajC [Litoreibacter roseus]